MAKQVVFIHGAGEGAYTEDARLVAGLRKELGVDYKVAYPRMPNEAEAPYKEWKQQLEKELEVLDGPVFMIGHSIGGSFILKYLGEANSALQVAGIFAIASPFWGGDGWLYSGYEELELPEDTQEKLTEMAKLFLYHCRDDEVVPFEHMALYKRLLPKAAVRPIDTGGHQLNNDLSLVAREIKSLI